MLVAILIAHLRADVFCVITKNVSSRCDEKGFTLVEIMIVVAIVGLLAAVVVPQYLRYRAFASKNACIENLRQIAAAKAVWAQEKNKSNGHTPAEWDLFGTTNYIKEKPRCPSGGADYMSTIGTVGEPPKCSLAVGYGHILPQ